MKRPAYSIVIAPAADRALRKLQRTDQERIRERIDALAADPRPPGIKALQGEVGVLRLRVGDYRVLYEVKDKVLLVMVLRVGHRSGIYR